MFTKIMATKTMSRDCSHMSSRKRVDDDAWFRTKIVSGEALKHCFKHGPWQLFASILLLFDTDDFHLVGDSALELAILFVFCRLGFLCQMIKFILRERCYGLEFVRVFDLEML